MVRGTTPTFTITINDDDVDLTTAENVYFTVTQRTTSVTKTGDDLTITAQTAACWLTQDEALEFSTGQAEIQVNWTYTDSDGNTRRAATKVKEIKIDKQLLDKVVE